MNYTHVAVLIGYIALMIAVGAWFGRAKATRSSPDPALVIQGGQVVLDRSTR